MTWTVEFDPGAQKELERLDREVARRIVSFLFARLATHENPRRLGEALKGAKFGSLWRYRVGDYRIIVDINDQTLCVLVLGIGNRREVYRR